jgi:Domain of unknown function (DUF4214)/PKD domain
MKKILVSAFALILSACGGQSSDEQPSKALLASSSMFGKSAEVKQIIPGERRSYNLSVSKTKTLIGVSRVASLAHFEKPSLEIRLQDISLTFDEEGEAGKLYRLYRAAFGRSPDVRGFGYWKNVLDSKTFSIDQVALDFLSSKESQTLYGNVLPNAEFVARIYQNVLGRTGDPAGIAYWITALERGESRSTVLLAIADSTENRVLTKDSISNGIPFAEPNVAYIPVSNAQGPTSVPVGIVFAVDGTQSTDANGDALDYAWSITSRPVSSTAAFAQPSIARPAISFDVPGTYQVTLWASDRAGRSFSPAQLQITAHSIQIDTGFNVCYRLDSVASHSLYSQGHTYLDRDRDGTPCTASDINLEKNPIATPISDNGQYKCATLSQSQAMLLYLQGHKYLDRDRDGRPCEANDITVERTTVVPPTTTPPSSGRCWVNGYRRSNGTWVNGYWRSC